MLDKSRNTPLNRILKGSTYDRIDSEMPIGTLVCVGSLFSDNVQTILLKHGTLWVTKSRILQDGYVWCRSLATGYDFDWHHHDLTPSNPEGD